MRDEKKILTIIQLQGLIADYELTTIEQVEGLIHNIIMGDEALEDVESTQYEADAKADHLSEGQFPNV